MPPRKAKRKREEQEVALATVTLTGGDAFPKGQIQLWHSGTLCDATVTVDGRCFQVHRNVLAACSPFMQGMLTSSMRERDGEIELREMSAAAFAACIEWMYTGMSTIAQSVLVDLLHAAAQLQLSELVTVVAQQIAGRLDCDNALPAWELGCRYDIALLKDAAKRVAAACFQSLPSGELQLIPCARLQELLDSNALAVKSEVQVFHALMTWASSPSNAVTADLLRTIRYPLLTQEAMEQVSHQSRDPVTHAA